MRPLARLREETAPLYRRKLNKKNSRPPSINRRGPSGGIADACGSVEMAHSEVIVTVLAFFELRPSAGTPIPCAVNMKLNIAQYSSGFNDPAAFIGMRSCT